MISSAQVVRAFSRELSRAGGLLAPDYLESGLSLAEARCLYEIGHGRAPTLTMLATELDLDLGYVSRVVSRLVVARLVRKRASSDRRARTITLTAAGERRLADLGARADDRIGRWLAAAGPARVDALVGGVRRFLADDRADQEPVEIRAAAPGDTGKIIARHGELYTQERGYPAAFEHYVVEAFAALVPGRDLVLVAERDGTVLGSVASVHETRRRIRLRFLLVEPRARGLGLGRRLVGKVVEHARAVGASEIVLDTASDLDAARHVYASYGFVKTKVRADAPWLPVGVSSETWRLDLR